MKIALSDVILKLIGVGHVFQNPVDHVILILAGLTASTSHCYISVAFYVLIFIIADSSVSESSVRPLYINL